MARNMRVKTSGVKFHFLLQGFFTCSFLFSIHVGSSTLSNHKVFSLFVVVIAILEIYIYINQQETICVDRWSDRVKKKHLCRSFLLICTLTWGLFITFYSTATRQVKPFPRLGYNTKICEEKIHNAAVVLTVIEIQNHGSPLPLPSTSHFGQSMSTMISCLTEPAGFYPLCS